MAGKFRFTFGPWNIHEGADPFGPMVRQSIEFEKKLELGLFPLPFTTLGEKRKRPAKQNIDIQNASHLPKL